MSHVIHVLQRWSYQEIGGSDFENCSGYIRGEITIFAIQLPKFLEEYKVKMGDNNGW